MNDALFLSIPGLVTEIIRQQGFGYEPAAIMVVYGQSGRIFADRVKSSVGLHDEELVSLARKSKDSASLLRLTLEVLEEAEKRRHVQWPRRRYRRLHLTWCQLDRFLEAQELPRVRGFGLYSPEAARDLIVEADPSLRVFI